MIEEYNEPQICGRSFREYLTLWVQLLKEMKKQNEISLFYSYWEELPENERILDIFLKNEWDEDIDIPQKGTPLKMITKKGTSEWVGEFENFSPFGNVVRIRLSEHVIIRDLKQYDGILVVEDIGLRKAIDRQINAIYQLFDLRTINKKLLNLLSNPFQIESGTKSQIYQWSQHTVGNSDSQSEAVKLTLGTRDLFLLQGPPGTGKTTVIAELVLQIIKRTPKARILITSQSHVAVDNALEKIKELAKELPGDAIARIGKASKVKIPELLLENHLKSWRDQIIEKTSARIVEYEAIKEPSNQVNNQVVQLLMDWQDELKNHYDELVQPYFTDICNVIGATCIGFAGNQTANELEFDWVIVDEAGRATFPETLVPIVQGRKIVLVGDHYQLPPTITESLKKALESPILKESGIDEAFMQTSLFEYLFTYLEKEPAQTVPIHMGLFQQYRMHPNIGSLISECFYKPNIDLKNAANTFNRFHGLSYKSKPISSVLWYNTTEQNNYYEIPKYEDGKIAGYYNEAEIRIVSNFLDILNRWYIQLKCFKLTKQSLRKLKDENVPENILEELRTLENSEIYGQEKFREAMKKCIGEEQTVKYETLIMKHAKLSKSIGIITAYSVQAQQLRRHLSRKKLESFYDIEIDTVDAYQGRDRDIIIYSIVRSSPEMELGQAIRKNKRSTLGFLKDDNGGRNRINVALSRARELLVIVGNKEIVRIENNNPLGRVARYIKSKSQWDYPIIGLRGIDYVSDRVNDVGEGDLDENDY